MRSTLLLLSAALAGQTVLAQQCFFPNGTAIFDNDNYNQYKPCSTGASTTCCALNRKNKPGGNQANGLTQDTCLPNGLCENDSFSNGKNDTTFFITFCTNSNVKSSQCINECGNKRSPDGGAQVTSCSGKNDSKWWCCGTDDSCCTADGGDFQLAANLGASTSSVASTSTNSATSTSTNSESASHSSGGISGGAIAGIVVGALAAVALVGAAAFFLLKRKQHQRLPVEDSSVPQSAASQMQYGSPKSRGFHNEAEFKHSPSETNVPMAELGSSGAVSELGSNPVVSELPGSDHRSPNSAQDSVWSR